MLVECVVDVVVVVAGVVVVLVAVVCFCNVSLSLWMVLAQSIPRNACSEAHHHHRNACSSALYRCGWSWRNPDPATRAQKLIIITATRAQAHRDQDHKSSELLTR